MVKEFKWYTVLCTDCGKSLAYSQEPLNCYQPVYCYLCAHSHAQIASLMMPVANKLAPNSLYAVGKPDNSIKLKSQFDKSYNQQFARLENHKVDKAKRKR